MTHFSFLPVLNPNLKKLCSKIQWTHELFQVLVREKWWVEQEDKCRCGCQRSRTARSWIRLGWDHMFSDVSAKRFVFRSRARPLCDSDCVAMQLRWLHFHSQNRCFGFLGIWCVRPEVHMCVLVMDFIMTWQSKRHTHRMSVFSSIGVATDGDHHRVKEEGGEG